ncbi:hypothetical protein FOZ61_008550 [Perkinsus olseni]|uniref:Deubiquitinating enzyme MINDY-3/4 conserved domain-containing protein n=1 Tax=Perkinsus olseni TaxID=32597 RepID=A0A7J6M6P4_PEROL|nr:hypothetical protein FOZ61_008550 [Perkinsus olseni]
MASGGDREVAFGRRAARPATTETLLPKGRSETAKFGRRAMKDTGLSSVRPPVPYSNRLSGFAGGLLKRDAEGYQSDEDDTPSVFRRSTNARAPRLGMAQAPVSERIGSALSTELRRLVFRDAPGYPSGWRQGFCFGDCGVPYCLVQARGGPCGVLAAVMAFMLKLMREEFPAGDGELGIGSPSDRVLSSRGTTPPPNAADDRRALLAGAMADILCGIAEASTGVVHLVHDLRSIERPQRASVSTLTGKAEVITALEASTLYEQYTRDTGLISFVYSSLLTRGLDSVREDTDDPERVTMLGDHGYGNWDQLFNPSPEDGSSSLLAKSSSNNATVLTLLLTTLSGIEPRRLQAKSLITTRVGSPRYCTQELVNLLLVGEAASNTFDGHRDLDGLTLRGIQATSCPIGLLSLYEHFKCLEVGDKLKHPTAGIWLVCAESHYSLLYAVGPDVDGDVVELRYFDQLMADEGEYRITLRRPSRGTVEPPRGMIEQCLRTRWQHHDILWNGRDPVL